MPDALAVDQNQRAGIALDRVARLDMGRAVTADILPVGTARQDAALQPAFDGSPDNIDDAPLADRRLAELQDVGELGTDAQDRFGGDQVHRQTYR